MKKNKIIIIIFFMLVFQNISRTNAQQQDVPEPLFMNFTIQPLYIPTYHGRDPFIPLDNFEKDLKINITDLDYLGVLILGKNEIALFSWRGNPSVRYTLKYRKLFSSGNILVDGIIGDITKNEVILVQGNNKFTYPRKQ